MNTFQRASAIVSSVVVGLSASAGVAHAIPLPDNNSSCGSSPCFTVTSNVVTANQATAIYAVTTASNQPGAKSIYGLSRVGVGVAGGSTSGSGVYGASTSGNGVLGASTSGNGVLGSTTIETASGVYGNNNSANFGGNGVLGVSLANGNAVYGDNVGTTGWAGNFNGDVGARGFFNNSDARLKKDVQDLKLGLEQLLKLHPVTYKWIKESNGKGQQIGLIAQEVQKIVPDFVRADGGTNMLTVNYVGLVPILIKAVQDQERMIQQQERRIGALEREKSSLRASLFSGNILGDGLAFGWMPLAALVAWRKRRSRAS